MTLRRSLLLVCLVAVAHGLFFTWYQRPDWATEWTDQDGYRRLGQALADTGKFTRFPDAPRFVPEVIRTPMYPAFVAVVYTLFGTSQIPIALAQTLVFAGICLLVYAIGLRTTGNRAIAIGAASATALFPPIPYFVPLVMTEVWTTLLFTLSMWLALRALHARSWRIFAALGVLIGLTTLSRPVFVLFPLALAAIGLVVFPIVGVQRRPRAAQWIVMLVAFGVTMLPWFGYNYATLGRFTLSPAGGVGRGLWEGSWQAAWSGRLQNELTHLADAVEDRAELDRRVEAIAEREHLPAAPMLEYVHQWEDIRLIWTAPADPYERAIARAAADLEYQRVAIQNLKADSPRHLVKRLARGVFILWAGEIPFSLQRDQRPATGRDSPVLGDTGSSVPRRARGARRPRARRTHRRSVPARRTDRVHHRRALPAVDRGTTVVAGAADCPAAGLDRGRAPGRPFTSPRSAGS